MRAGIWATDLDGDELNDFLQSFGISRNLYLLIAVVIYLLISTLLSRVGGWHELASRYPALGEPDGGEKFNFRSVALRKWSMPTNYTGFVTVILTEQGVYLNVALFFRFQHEPIFIPWASIENVTAGPTVLTQFFTLHVAGSKTGITISGEPGQKIAQRVNARNTYKRRKGKAA